MEDELICEAVVDHERDDDTEDNRCVSALDGEWLFEGVDLQEDCGYGDLCISALVSKFKS